MINVNEKHTKRIIEFIFFSIIVFPLEYIYATPKIFMVKKEEWSHPVEKIFNHYDISLYKVYYSKDGTCPTFYVRFKYPPMGNTHSIDYQKIYTELIKANSNYPYALVDKEDNVKINVGWNNETRKSMIVDVGKANTLTTCKGNSHANVDDEEDYDKFSISLEMKKHILNSPYKAPLQRADGRKFVAYLYAEKTKNYMKQDMENMDKFIKTKALVGQYYIYLYDVTSDSFFPGRVKIFNRYYTSIMNGQRAEFFSLPTASEKNSDLLLVSKVRYIDPYIYEAYGFTKSHNFLKKYIFLNNDTKDTFEGIINKKVENGSITAQGFYGEQRGKVLRFFLSDPPGAIKTEIQQSIH